MHHRSSAPKIVSVAFAPAGVCPEQPLPQLCDTLVLGPHSLAGLPEYICRETGRVVNSGQRRVR